MRLFRRGGGIDNLFQSKQINYARLYTALINNLMPTTTTMVQQNFFDGKIENFLTCLNIIPYLRGKVIDDLTSDFLEEVSLKAINQALYSRLQMADVYLLIYEMPRILLMNYPAVKSIRETLLQIIPHLIAILQENDKWVELINLERQLNLLKSFK